MSEASSIRVLIIDDHRAFADAVGLALELEPDIEVVATVGSVAAGLEAVDTASPDVVLLDYMLPDGVGSTVCRHAVARLPQTKVVMLSGHSELAVVLECVQAGASAFLPKERPLAEVGEAIRQASSGDSLLSRSALQSLVMHLASDADAARRGPAGGEAGSFTPREFEVLQCLADGCTNSEIAERLVISPHTARTHVQNILGKLGVHSKLAAVAEASRLGLLPSRRAG